MNKLIGQLKTLFQRYWSLGTVSAWLYLHAHHSQPNLQRRFVMRVLAPPFLILFILGLVGLWQYDRLVKEQVINELQRSSATTSIKLAGDLELRQTIQKRTGEDLFKIKSQYQIDRQRLDTDHQDCKANIKQNNNYTVSPPAACQPFLAALAFRGNSLQSIENDYVRKSEELIKVQNQQINDKLSAFKQFFPDTVALVIVNNEGHIVSSALAGDLAGSVEDFREESERALKIPVQGKIMLAENVRLGVFAYPIKDGSVLAAYNLDNDNFLKDILKSTPVDKQRVVAIILDSEGRAIYPPLRSKDSFTDKNELLRQNKYINVDINNTPHIAVGSETAGSKWLVMLASPKAAVLAPVRDAQLLGILIVGSLLVGFLWVGTFFIQRTARNIIKLVHGAAVFGSGKLSYQVKLDHADAEFMKLADTLNTMAKRIDLDEKEIDRKNKEFISIATHELRAPLTAIIGYLSMLREDYSKTFNKKARGIIEEVYYDSSRLRDLINDMLNVARLEGAENDVQLKLVDTDKVVSDVIRTSKAITKKSKIELSYDNARMHNVLADESRLRIVLNNLISNAIKYNRPEGSVKISYKLKGKMLVIAIADTGLGIPDDQQAKIFEKFFRVNHDDRKHIIGTGLGMFITHRYIIEMGGKIWFTSEHGKGTTFYFSLPIAK
jgi:signal transduction histidine kinase